MHIPLIVGHVMRRIAEEFQMNIKDLFMMVFDYFAVCVNTKQIVKQLLTTTLNQCMKRRSTIVFFILRNLA